MYDPGPGAPCMLVWSCARILGPRPPAHTHDGTIAGGPPLWDLWRAYVGCGIIDFLNKINAESISNLSVRAWS